MNGHQLEAFETMVIFEGWVWASDDGVLTI
jgi:hypothetical protein